MPERRYSRYRQEDVWIHMVQLQYELAISIIPDTVHGNSVSIERAGQEHRAVVLARSSDWYHFSLNCVDRFRHGITCLIVGTHDSCIDRPVLAIDALHWYEAKKMRSDFGQIQPRLDGTGKLIPDLFEKKRKSAYGHNMLIGALMCKRPDALARLATFQPSTRLRIEAEVHRLHKRRIGRPLEVWPVERARKERRDHEIIQTED